MKGIYSATIKPGVVVTVDHESRDPDVSALKELTDIKVSLSSHDEQIELVREGLARMLRIEDNDGLNYVREHIATNERLVEIFNSVLSWLPKESFDKVVYECAMGLVSDSMVEVDKAGAA